MSEQKYQIYIFDPKFNHSVPITLPLNHTFDEVRDLLYRKHPEAFYPAADYFFSLENSIPDQSQTLQDAGVEENSILTVRMNADNKDITFEGPIPLANQIIPDFLRFRQIKESLASAIHRNAAALVITYNGTVCDDEKTVRDLELPSPCTLQYAISDLITINLRYIRAINSVDIAPNKTVSELLQEAIRLFNIRADSNVRLLKNSVPMNPGDTLESCGIQPDAVIEVYVDTSGGTGAF